MSKQDTTPVDGIENDAQPEEEGIEPEAAVAESVEVPAEVADSATAQAPVSALEQQVADAKQQAQNYSDGWQRERADFSNYKKRAERDLLTMRFNAKVDTLKTLLPVLDDFERAMDNLPDDVEDQPWLDGISAIQRKLATTLENEGIETLDPVGEVFDPTLHEAIGQDSDSDMASNHVTVTLQKGYICGDRVLRPALVRVAQ